MKRRLLWSVLLSVVLLSGAAWADDRHFDLDVPAGNLSAAVETLAKQTSLQVLFDQSLLEGKTTPGLHGSYTAREALEKLLEGSGIGFSFTAEDAVSLNRSAASGEPTKPTELPEINVTEAVESGYAVPNATTATKTDTPIKDVPQSIEVRDRQILDDLGGKQTSYDVSRTVAGVFNSDNGNGAPGFNSPQFYVRGFYNSGVYLKDGQMRIGWMSTMDMANIDRVEFLKGPASVLYGTAIYGGNIGGLVNYVSKFPTASPITAFDVTAGSYNFYRGTIDYDRPLNEDKTVLFRLNAAIEYGQSFRDYAQHDTEFIAPAFSFQLSPADSLTLLTDFTLTHNIPANGLPITPESLAIPPERNYIDPSFAHDTNQATNATLKYEHRFNPDWHINADYSFGYGSSRSHSNTLNFEGSGGTNSLSGAFWNISDMENTLDVRLAGKIQTWMVEHQLLTGYTYWAQQYKSFAQFGPDVALPSVSLAQLPSPAPGIYPGVPSSPSGTFHWKNTMNALYVQDLISLPLSIKILGGARYDWIRQNNHWEGLFASGNPQTDNVTQTFSHLSPRAGLVYQGIRATSLYFVYSTSFIPNGGVLTQNQQDLPPEKGVMEEAGIKYEFNDRLAANVAVYEIRRSNILQCNPNDPNCLTYILAGQMKSHGIELDINGQVTDAFRLNVAASLLKAWVTEPDPGGALTAGNEFAGVPTGTFNVFGVYSFGARREWETGGGVYYASSAWADDANTFRLPEIVQIDAMAAYRFNKTYRLQIDGKNLANRNNYTSTSSWIIPAEPVSVFVSLKAEL